ncbi:MAG: hypothetical protein ACK475_10820 [Bacteroidota bacterium]|jgi:hypothetical protein
MSILTTTTARTMMYFFSIGGLLVVNGAAVTYLWNTMLESGGSSEPLRFLEGVGITAFAYVLVFAIKYGRGVSPLIKRQRSSDTSVERKCAEMTPEQRGELRRHLAATCARADEEVKSSTFVHEHHI